MLKKVIFDTDIGCDCDDVLALAYLLQSGCLIGVTCSAVFPNAPVCVEAIAEQYGYRNLPVGMIENHKKDYYKGCPDMYATKVANKFATDKIGKEYPEAVQLIRELLTASDEKVTIVITGPLTNIANLLKSDNELVREKVAEFVSMGGCFAGEHNDRGEFNIACDVESAQDVVELSPVSVVFLPFETGLDMITGAKMVARDGDTKPASYAYIEHGSANGRHSWDPATAVYAVHGSEPWYEMIGPGTVSFDDKGVSRYIDSSCGLHYYLNCKLPKEIVADEIDGMV
ncbi:MAG: nucleoside hydrolase [Oscillospiraceae bacterium]|nr:nucleoside hydrolase [Oscillospiraceae bacterium]